MLLYLYHHYCGMSLLLSLLFLLWYVITIVITIFIIIIMLLYLYIRELTHMRCDPQQQKV